MDRQAHPSQEADLGADPKPTKWQERPHNYRGKLHQLIDLIPIRNLTWNIVPKNHGPATQVRGSPAREMVSFLGAADLGTKSVLERISIQNQFFESESVLPPLAFKVSDREV